jgi:hypothetical protein
MPGYDIVERHHISVPAPAGVTFAAAKELDLQASLVVRGVFKAREFVLGSRASIGGKGPQGLIPQMENIGWRVLAETPGREIVMGAVTQPWQANVVFRGLPPDEFVRFCEPGYVKIAWTLRADPSSGGQSIFRTETRAVATDSTARRKFRRYWSLVSPGIVLIRWMMLVPVRAAAVRANRAPT